MSVSSRRRRGISSWFTFISLLYSRWKLSFSSPSAADWSTPFSPSFRDFGAWCFSLASAAFSSLRSAPSCAPREVFSDALNSEDGWALAREASLRSSVAYFGGPCLLDCWFVPWLECRLATKGGEFELALLWSSNTSAISPLWSPSNPIGSSPSSMPPFSPSFSADAGCDACWAGESSAENNPFSISHFLLSSYSSDSVKCKSLFSSLIISNCSLEL